MIKALAGAKIFGKMEDL